MLARFREPAIVRLPLFIGGIAGQDGVAGLGKGEAVGERMRFGLAVANAGAAYECIKSHGSLQSADLILRVLPWLKQ